MHRLISQLLESEIFQLNLLQPVNQKHTMRIAMQPQRPPNEHFSWPGSFTVIKEDPKLTICNISKGTFWAFNLEFGQLNKRLSSEEKVAINVYDCTGP